MKLYAGLDLSMRRTGIVVLREDGTVLLSETIGATAKQRPCRTLEERICYYREIADRVKTIIDTRAYLCHLAIEDYAAHSPGDPTIGPELGGIVRHYLVDGWCNHSCASIVEVSVSQVKSLATGNGAAKKEAVVAGVLAKWGFDCGGDDNLADSFTLARWAMGDRPAPKVAKAAVKRAKLTQNLAPKPAKQPKVKKLSRKAQRQLESDAAADALIASAPF